MRFAGPKPTIEETIRYVRENWVWCQGWSPSEGAFGRPMRALSYRYECAEEKKHPDSGCRNATSAKLTETQIRMTAEKLLPGLILAWERDVARDEKMNAANNLIGDDSRSQVEIGDDLVHIRSSRGIVAVIERIDGKFVGRLAREGEKVYV